MTKSKQRELWVDYSRAIACFLVAIGHLFMSFTEASMIENRGLDLFIKTIYHFHVYIFFFCSGYLFQKTFAKRLDKREYWKHKFERFIDMLIPYVFFSMVTYLIKVIFSGDVNTDVNESFMNTILEAPINQMWFLYALIIIQLLTPVIMRRENIWILLIIAVLLKGVNIINPITLPAIIRYFFADYIWFLLGMIFAYSGVFLKRKYTYICLIMFIIIDIFTFIYNIDNRFVDCILTLVGVLGIISLVQIYTKNIVKMKKIWECLSKYMFQIYLLHTICAAGIRIILLKFTINNFWIHFVLGILFSFMVPVLCAWIAEKTIILEIVFYPTKTIKQFIRMNKKCTE